MENVIKAFSDAGNLDKHTGKIKNAFVLVDDEEVGAGQEEGWSRREHGGYFRARENGSAEKVSLGIDASSSFHVKLMNSFQLSFTRSIYKKAGVGKEKQDVTYIVAKKGVGRRIRRPAGVKGAFRVVDGRLKKDTRAAQRKNERQRGKGGRGNKGGQGRGNKGGRGMKAGKGRPKKWATPLTPSFRLSSFGYY